jgi:hypothetical protein
MLLQDGINNLQGLTRKVSQQTVAGMGGEQFEADHSFESEQAWALESWNPLRRRVNGPRSSRAGNRASKCSRRTRATPSSSPSTIVRFAAHAAITVPICATESARCVPADGTLWELFFMTRSRVSWISVRLHRKARLKTLCSLHACFQNVFDMRS